MSSTCSTRARRGEPLTNNGVTIWLQGSVLSDLRGVPTAADYAAAIARWDTIRAKLITANYELFLYYKPATGLYRKYRSVNTVLLFADWGNPLGLGYLLGATTTDKVLYNGVGGSSSS